MRQSRDSQERAAPAHHRHLHVETLTTIKRAQHDHRGITDIYRLCARGSPDDDRHRSREIPSAVLLLLHHSREVGVRASTGEPAAR